MDAVACRKGVPLCGELPPLSRWHCPAQVFASDDARRIAGLLAMHLAASAASLNEIRLTESLDGVWYTLPISTRAYRAMRHSCKHFASLLRRLNATLDKLNCDVVEKAVFVKIERGASEVFLRLSKIKIKEATTEYLLCEGLRLTKDSILCHALCIDSHASEFQRVGFLRLAEKSRDGLWLHTIWTCVRVATEGINKLKATKKPLKRRNDAEVLLCKIEEIVRSLVDGLGSMADLVHDIGEDMTPLKPAGLDEIFRFADRAMSMAEYLRKDWDGLARCENNKREEVRLWLAELSVTLVRVCPHPVPVPRAGWWYEYI